MQRISPDIGTLSGKIIRISPKTGSLPIDKFDKIR